MIRRRGAFDHEVSSDDDDDDDDDDEDAFAALSRKSAKRAKPIEEGDSKGKAAAAVAAAAAAAAPLSASDDAVSAPKPVLPAPTTSSMRRHHLPNDTRKAKLDALLDELKADTKQLNKGDGDRRRGGGGGGGIAGGGRGSNAGFVPEKKGSFVEPGEEHLTTNIFVGNLSPSITEEQLSDLFSQFGDLYSVKIMWPRTPAERSRNRNTGFVCFMNREDAEEAMEACSETDPFNVGRFLMMRWGKNVKKTVKKGTAIAPIRKKSTPSNKGASDDSGESREDRQVLGEHNEANVTVPVQPQDMPAAFQPVSYQPELHERTAIRVELPPDRDRLQFINTVASFVATDGYSFEQMLVQNKSDDPAYSFLTFSENDEAQRKEYVFYRWRVYSFCQGDGHFRWRTYPFVMFHPNGRWWIPPEIDEEAARQEEYDERLREESKLRQKKERRRQLGRRGFMTGRQLERGGPNTDGSAKLSPAERKQFDHLLKRQLTTSRKSICEAMAFCFEKSWAAKEIALMLKLALTEEGLLVSVDTRVARLYLLSDILFNSQQPGVRNAFLYRSAIEAMAPEVFRSLGKHGGGTVGRLTMNKLRNAVSSVLAAWTEWSVYSPTFMDELEAYFEGREVSLRPQVEEKFEEDKTEQMISECQTDEKEIEIKPVEIKIDMPMGNWEEVVEEDDGGDDVENDDAQSDQAVPLDDDDGSDIGSEDLAALPSNDDERNDNKMIAIKRKDPESATKAEDDPSDSVTTSRSIWWEGNRVKQEQATIIKHVDDAEIKQGDVIEVNQRYDSKIMHDDAGMFCDSQSIDGEDIDTYDSSDDVDGTSLSPGDIDGSSLNSDDFGDTSHAKESNSSRTGTNTKGEASCSWTEDLDGEELGSSDIGFDHSDHIDGEMIGGSDFGHGGKGPIFMVDDIDGAAVDGADFYYCETRDV